MPLSAAPRRSGSMRVLQRNNVKVKGAGQKAMVFAHGFGCDQSMWRFVWPAFADDYSIILFDHVGCGGSDPKAYDAGKYSSLGGYADDIVEICRELGVSNGVFVGHSVSAMIGAWLRSEHPTFSRTSS